MTKISLIGNCQTKALTWYIQQLDPSFDVEWICIEPFLPYWGPNRRFNGKPIPVISDIKKGIERVKCSDYIIYQHTKTSTSKAYNPTELKKHAKIAKLISISSFFYDPEEPKYFNGMKQRAKENNVDIPAHKLIEKHGSKITVAKYNHPHVFYFLELVREICEFVGWDYYSDHQYNQYYDRGYPFGKQ